MLLKYIRNEKGIALVLLALSIIVLFGFGALAVDVGHLYNVKNQLQVAADSAALAGAAKLDPTASNQFAQPVARDEAARYAARNTADVAYDNVPAVAASFSPGADAGAAIPVALDRGSDTNSDTGDIFVGYWDGSAFSTTIPTGEYANAVKVIARRTGARLSQPSVQSMFARVLKLLGSDFDFTAIAAEAIAARVDKAPVLPVAVNEYWGTDRNNNTNWDITRNRPGFYGPTNRYANSFVRQTNVDLSTSTMVGNIFGVVGQYANDNRDNQSVNSYVDLDARYDGNGSSFVVPSNSSGCTSPCSFPSGASTSQKYGAYLEYLHYGYPRALPTAVDETFLLPYPPDPDPIAPLSGPCSCPWPNVNSFPASGNCLVQTDSEGQRFYDVLKKGDRFIAMVYNGAFYPSGSDRVVTIVGYCAIEIDGYDDGLPPRGWLRSNAQNYSGAKAFFGDSGNTAYGHVVPHGIAGTNDLYILQRRDATSDCNLLAKVRVMQLNAANKGASRLVGQGVKYGMTGTNQY